MIIGTSHISISSFNIQKDIEDFCKNGFFLSFLDENIGNNIEKRLYLKKYSAFHSIAVLTGKSGIDIELVEHHKENTGTTNKNIDVVFDGGRVKQVEYKVQKLDESVDFWQNYMGFIPAQQENSFSILEKKSMFPKWNCKVRLTKTDSEFNEPKIDNGGATSFAFFTTNLAKAMDLFHQKYDALSTNIFQMNVNGKDLEISMLSGPSNEIIELIQIKNE